MPSQRTQSDDPTVEDVKAQLEALQKDVRQLAETVAGVARSSASAAGDKARSALHDAGETVAEVETRAADYVRQRPFQALAIAAGLGLLLGYVTRR